MSRIHVFFERCLSPSLFLPRKKISISKLIASDLAYSTQKGAERRSVRSLVYVIGNLNLARDTLRRPTFTKAVGERGCSIGDRSAALSRRHAFPTSSSPATRLRQQRSQRNRQDKVEIAATQQPVQARSNAAYAVERSRSQREIHRSLGEFTFPRIPCPPNCLRCPRTSSSFQDEFDLPAAKRDEMFRMPLEKKWQLYCSTKFVRGGKGREIVRWDACVSRRGLPIVSRSAQREVSLPWPPPRLLSSPGACISSRTRYRGVRIASACGRDRNRASSAIVVARRPRVVARARFVCYKFRRCHTRNARLNGSFLAKAHSDEGDRHADKNVQRYIDQVKAFTRVRASSRREI